MADLLKIWHAVAGQHRDKDASILRVGMQLYYIHPHVVLVKDANEDEMRIPERQPQEVKGFNLCTLRDEMRVAPETFLANGRKTLTIGHLDPDMWFLNLPPGKSPDTLPSDIWALWKNRENVYELMAPMEGTVDDSLPIEFALHKFPDVLLGALAEQGQEALEGCTMQLARSRLGSRPVLFVMQEGTSLLMTQLRYMAGKSIWRDIVAGDITYVGDAWDEHTDNYKKLIKKRKPTMKGLTNPVTGIKKPTPAPKAEPAPAVEPKAEPLEDIKVPEALEETVADIKEAQPAETAQETPATPAQEHAPIKVTLPEPQAEIQARPEAQQVQVVVDTYPQQVLNEPEPQAPAEAPKKRQSKPAATAKLDALVKLTEDLKGTVEPIPAECFDQAQEEIRVLRDLQFVITRRMANITIEMYKTAKGTLDKYAAIQQLMK